MNLYNLVDNYNQILFYPICYYASQFINQYTSKEYCKI